MGGGAPAAGTWGRKTRPGTRAAAGAKNNARAPAPTAARRVPSGPALSPTSAASPSGPAPARARGGARGTRAPLRGAGDTRRRVARGSGAPGSAQARQYPPSGLSRGPGRLLTAPRPTATYPRPSPPGLRAAPYRPRGPVRARGAGVAVVVALLGRLVRAHATASCQSPEGIPRGTASPRAAGGQKVLGLWSWPLHLSSSHRPSLGSRPLPTLLPLGFLSGANPFHVQKPILLRALGLLNSMGTTGCQDLG